jgi:hypothetical protein
MLMCALSTIFFVIFSYLNGLVKGGHKLLVRFGASDGDLFLPARKIAQEVCNSCRSASRIVRLHFTELGPVNCAFLSAKEVEKGVKCRTRVPVYISEDVPSRFGLTAVR